MDVITGNDTPYNLGAPLFANLTYDISYQCPKLALKHLLSVLGNPNDGVTMVANDVTAGFGEQYVPQGYVLKQFSFEDAGFEPISGE